MESRASTNGLMRVCTRVGGLRLSLLLAGLLLVLPACKTSGTSPAKQPPPPAYLVHVVQYPGETLSIIAGWYTGSPRNWELLLDANPGLNPKRIRLGDSIRIPRELLSREDRMPRSVMGNAQRKGTAAPSDSSPNTSADSTSGGSGMSETAPPSAEPSSETMPEATAEEPGSVMEELLAPTESEGASEETPSNIDESMPTEPVSAIVEGSESGLEEYSDIQEPSSENTEAPANEQPSSEMRIKSRDELLKELLEE